MDAPKVSVCMITYNHERYIGQAVQSVLDQQTNFPIEIVIGEDCSTDDTRGVVMAFASCHPRTIRLLLADENMGGKRNFMRTFAACRGQYVNILEGDDYWTCPHKLQLQADALDARPDWAMCFHPTEVIFDDWRKAPAQWPEKWDKKEASLADLFVSNFIPTTAALFRNGLFGDFPPWFADLTVGDWPLHMLNAVHGNIGFLSQAMSAYRVHRGGVWTSTSRGDQLAALLKVLSTVDRHFDGKYSGPIDECRYHILKTAIDEADAAKLRANDLADADAACRQLERENLRLRKILERSLPRVILREMARPMMQLWSTLQRRPSRSPEQQRAA